MGRRNIGDATTARPDLEARVDAAAALNRLAHGLVRHRVDAQTLGAIAADADARMAVVEASPLRLRRMDRSIERGESDRRWSLREATRDGRVVDLFDESPISGSTNPLTMGLRVGSDGDEVVASITLGWGFEGAPRRSHGGIVAAIVDEVFGAVLPLIECIAFTGELTIRYEAPCPIGVPLEFRAGLVGRDRRKLYLEGVGTTGGEVFVRSKATFIQVDSAGMPGTQHRPLTDIAPSPTKETHT